MTDPPVLSDARIEIARNCLEEVCNDYYLKPGLNNDDMVVMNMSEVVMEAFNAACMDKPFSFDRLHEIDRLFSLRQSQLDKFAFALSTLLQLLLGGRREETAAASTAPNEKQAPSTSKMNTGNGEVKIEDDLFDEMPTLDNSQNAKNVEVKEEPMDEDTGADEAVAGPSTAHDSVPAPLSLWIKPRRPNLIVPPIKCAHCDHHATPGNAMGAHMEEAHAELLPQLFEKYAQEFGTGTTPAEPLPPPPKKKTPPPPPQESEEMIELREEYAEVARDFKDRYLPKASRPRKNPPTRPKEKEPERGRTMQRSEKKANRPCSYCRCPITTSKRRDEHMRKEHPNEWLKLDKCPEPCCDFRTCEPRLMVEHEKENLRQHRALRDFKFPKGTCCPHCPQPVHAVDDYNAHMTEEHPFQLLSKNKERRLGSGGFRWRNEWEYIFKCGTCTFHFSRLHALANHWVNSTCPPSICFDDDAANRAALTSDEQQYVYYDDE